jgi:hypothetical protein
MTMFFVSTMSLPSTSILPGATIFAVPRIGVILFFLNRKSIPLVLPSIASWRKTIICLRSSVGETPMPILAKECPASAKSSEACSSALDGIQPTLRQVPPWVARFSITATFMPSWAARMAQT